jgi:hypothetical protein
MAYALLMSPSRPRVSLAVVFFGILLLLGLNLFVLGPWVAGIGGEVAGNILFVVLRIAALAGFGFLARGIYGRGRWDAIRLGTMLEFMDHTLFRGAMLAWDYRQNPSAWVHDGQAVSLGSALFNLLMSFVVFFPAIFLLVFVGGELGNAWRAKRGGSIS